MVVSVRCILLFGVFLAVSMSGVVSIKRVRDQMYVDLQDNHPCFRLLNGTMQVGCHSPGSRSIGVLYFVEKQEDIDYILDDPDGRGPFIVAMTLKDFRETDTVNKFHDSKKVRGMLLFHDENDERNPFSEDTQCPNEASGLYRKDSTYGSCRRQKWNVGGAGYRFMDFKIPIFMVTNNTEQHILKELCYVKFNKPKLTGGISRPYPLCAVQLYMFNYAAGTSVRCLRRNTLISGLENPHFVCDTIGDYNVYSFIPPTNKSLPLDPNSVFMLAARMDSISMFTDFDPGAESSLGNVVALLAIVEALGRNKAFITSHSRATGKYLMPVFFHGESLDYIGSSRMVWDITNKNFPYPLKEDTMDQPALFSLENLAFILEFNQVGMPHDGYFLHADPTSLADQLVNEMVTNVSSRLESYSDGAIKSALYLGSPLPPSSIQSFLTVNRSIPALLVTDHEKEFTNTYYNSFADEPYHINRSVLMPKLINMTNAVLKLAFEWVSDGQTPQNWQVDESVIDSLMDCMWSWPKWTCSIFDRLDASLPKVPDTPSPYEGAIPAARTYVAPFRRTSKFGMSRGHVRTFVDYSMVYFLGEKFLMPNVTNKCESSAFFNSTGTIYTYRVMVDLFDNSSNASYCIVSGVNLSEALSPAFKIDGYDFKSGEYSTWVESQWDVPYVRVFLKADPMWEGAVFVVGLLVILTSLILVYVIERGSTVLFSSTEITAL